MKKSFVILLMITLLTGCTKQSAIDKIHKRFYNMPSYKANTLLTVTTDNTQNTYGIKVLYDCTTDTYRLDFDDITVVVERNKAHVKKGTKITDTAVSEKSMLMLINTFFESYYTGETSQKSTDISGNTILECNIINPPKYAKSMKLWIDSRKIIPKKMHIYNKDEKQIMEIRFKQFEILESVDSNEFNY